MGNKAVNKPYFVWDAELYSVGDATIDEQHQRLLTVMNRLYLLIHDEGGIANITGTTAMMQELTQFIVDHFSYEEQRLQESSYPLDSLARHRAEHNGFVEKVQGFEQRMLDADPTVLDDMLPYLYGDWLIQHICGTDMGYRGYLQPVDPVVSGNLPA